MKGVRAPLVISKRFDVALSSWVAIRILRCPNLLMSAHVVHDNGYNDDYNGYNGYNGW